MTDNPKKQADDDRPTYEAPRAMRMVDMHPGKGDCEGPGSADYACDPNGNGAFICAYEGSDPDYIP